MKFTLKWLKDHLETDVNLSKIIDTLPAIGFEVENVIDRKIDLGAFVIAEVLEVKRHPNADRLQVLKVNNGKEIFQIICGAPNVRVGMKGVFAAEGVYIPGIDASLKKTKIRDVESSGMMLSEREMGISDEHTKIIELETQEPPGTLAIQAMGLDDPIIEIAIMPNRSDCLGVHGIARDLAAAGIGKLKPLLVDCFEPKFNSPIRVHLDFSTETQNACPYFVGCYIRNVKNRQSPQWIKNRLLAIGLRPASALVDITNYITYDLCRPLHVFDANKICGDLHVRLAKKGETLSALDGKTYTLDDTMTVISDENAVQAIAGVMGGNDSSCTEETTDLFLEIAYFDPVRTAATGRKLNLQSDARYRFERGVDPAFLIDAAHIASHLILDLCGGESSSLVTVGKEPDWERSYTLRPDRVYTLGGVEVPIVKIEKMLRALGCDVGKHDDGNLDAGSLLVHIPSWRHDIVGEADLIEEVLRLHGYHNIPITPLERETCLPMPALSPIQKRRTEARRILATRGLHEAVTYSFMPSKQAKFFTSVSDDLRLVNPISRDLDVMRPSILPNLITVIKYNADHGFHNIGLFELGPQFCNDTPEGQDIVIAGLRSGYIGYRNWAQPSRKVDVFDAKADAISLLNIDALLPNTQIRPKAPPWYHPGRAGTITLGKNILAHFGEIHPRILRDMNIKSPITAFEVYIDNIPVPKKKGLTRREPLRLSSFQPVERDFSFVLDVSVTAHDLIHAVKSANTILIEDVRVFDLFAGVTCDKSKKKKSLAVNIILQPFKKTLTESDLESLSKKIITNVKKMTGGMLRE